MSDNTDRLDKWYEKLLEVYPEVSQSSVESGRKVLHRYNPDDEILGNIYSWVLEWNRYTRHCIQNKLFIKRLPNLYTFFNDSRWMDPIPSYSTSVSSSPTESVIKPCVQCGAKSFNNKLCPRCYTKEANPDFKQQMTENLRKMGFNKLPNETWRDTSMRCLTANGLAAMIPETITRQQDETDI